MGTGWRSPRAAMPVCRWRLATVAPALGLQQCRPPSTVACHGTGPMRSGFEPRQGRTAHRQHAAACWARQGVLLVASGMVVRRHAARACLRGAAAMRARGRFSSEGSAVGLDFGTTNSAVAVQREDGTVEVVPPEGAPYGMYTMPSVVAVNSDGQELVGFDALRIKPDGRQQAVFHSVKRLLGRTYGDCFKVGVNPNELGADPSGKAHEPVRLLLPGKLGVCLPEQMASRVILALLNRAEAYLGRPVERVVMGVPARFEPWQVAALEEAVKLCGVKAVRLVAEPELAVRSYSYNTTPMELQNKLAEETQSEDAEIKHLLVVDLGGGTMDVCAIKHFVEWKEVQILFTCGDERLGGDDFDMDICSWAQKNIGLPKTLWTKENRRRLRLLARQVKENLTRSKTTELKFEGRRLPLSRGDLNIVVRKTLRRMMEVIGEACSGAEIQLPFETLAIETLDASDRNLKKKKKGKEVKVPKQKDQTLEKMSKSIGVTEPDDNEAGVSIDQVVCVGAATRMPAVRELLSLMTGVRSTHSHADPETAVAVGAAILAYTMDTNEKGVFIASNWRTKWVHFLNTRPDLIARLRKEQLASATGA